MLVSTVHVISVFGGVESTAGEIRKVSPNRYIHLIGSGLTYFDRSGSVYFVHGERVIQDGQWESQRTSRREMSKREDRV